MKILESEMAGEKITERKSEKEKDVNQITSEKTESKIYEEMVQKKEQSFKRDKPLFKTLYYLNHTSSEAIHTCIIIKTRKKGRL